MIIPDDVKNLIHKYIEQKGKRPLPFNYDEWNSFTEYKEYLEKELEKQHLLKSRCFYYGKKVGNMELKDTIELMNSADYKERFKAEYLQAKIRYDKLDAMTVKYEAGTLNFTPSCSLELLKEQKKHMGNYIRTLKIRAEIEKIDLQEGE